MITSTAFRASANRRHGVREARAPGAPGAQAAVKPLAPAMRWLLFAAAALVFLAGFQLFVLTEHTGTYFAWTIANPPAAGTGPSTARRCRSKPACPGCSRPAMCGRNRSNGLPPRSERVRPPFRSYTAGWKPWRSRKPREELSP